MERVVVAFAATKVVEAVDTDLVAIIVHASSPSSSDWVGSKTVCLSGGGFMSSSYTKTSGVSFADVVDIFLTK
jgi:hypothetical protein